MELLEDSEEVVELVLIDFHGDAMWICETNHGGNVEIGRCGVMSCLRGVDKTGRWLSNRSSVLGNGSNVYFEYNGIKVHLVLHINRLPPFSHTTVY